MENKIKLPENVMLIDAAYLNFAIQDLRGYFESVLKRELQQIDVAELISYLALDSNYAEGESTTQVMFVYDDQSEHLVHCLPSSLKEELDGVAFNSPWGEFVFASVPTADMTTRADILSDLLQIVLDSSDVKRLVVVSHEEYADQVTPLLQTSGTKEAIQFTMQEPAQSDDYRCELLPFPIMQAMGIRGDELQ